jgi:DNA-binding transcriptional ArsR family regulator
LERGDHEAALATLDRADRICAEAGLSDLAVELLSIRGSALLAARRPGAAVAATREAVESVTPGVERVSLVHHRHALAARAAGRIEEAKRAALVAHQLLEATLQGLPIEQREGAIERVPEHREIVASGIRLSPQTIQVRLPTVGAPTGRPLGDDDLRQVTWTIDHPDDERVASPLDRRRVKLLRLLAEAHGENAAPTIEHLAGALSVSDSTVRRDLVVLQQAGHHVSTRGQRKRVS